MWRPSFVDCCDWRTSCKVSEDNRVLGIRISISKLSCESNGQRTLSPDYANELQPVACSSEAVLPILCNFPQNNMIRVSRLVELWVSEGFVRPVSGKRLEIVAEEYLHELIGRNLIILRKPASDGRRVKFCKIHDLLRDLSLREALKENFLGFAMRHIFGIHESAAERDYGNTMSLYRSFVVFASRTRYSSSDPVTANLILAALDRFLSKTGKGEGKDSKSLQEIVNLRYLAMFESQVRPFSRSPSSLCRLWNLHTLIVGSAELDHAPVEIWRMPQLRHVMFIRLYLPDPPQDDHGIILGNLQTLSEVSSFKLSEEVVRRIPNLTKLKVSYYTKLGGVEEVDYCINKIGALEQLESLSCSFFDFKDNRDYMLENLIFPQSLKKLSLEGRTFLQWGDMCAVIGVLPNFQVLKLSLCAFVGAEWKTVEDQFSSLKYLVIDTCLDLESWITESSHFPCLEHLVLRDMERLTEIPSDMGYIPTLRSIELDRCTDSAVSSAKDLLEEQEDFGRDIRIRVKLWKLDEQLLSLASSNFLIRV